MCRPFSLQAGSICVTLCVAAATWSSAGCGKRGGVANFGKDVLAQVLVRVGSQIILEVLDNYEGANHVSPPYIHEFESPQYYLDSSTGLMVHANRLGGVNYWTPEKVLAGFSAWYAPTQEFHYFDGWGNRLY
jgi:hypothetical protein